MRWKDAISMWRHQSPYTTVIATFTTYVVFSIQTRAYSEVRDIEKDNTRATIHTLVAFWIFEERKTPQPWRTQVIYKFSLVFFIVFSKFFIDSIYCVKCEWKTIKNLDVCENTVLNWVLNLMVSSTVTIHAFVPGGSIHRTIVHNDFQLFSVFFLFLDQKNVFHSQIFSRIFHFYPKNCLNEIEISISKKPNLKITHNREITTTNLIFFFCPFVHVFFSAHHQRFAKKRRRRRKRLNRNRPKIWANCRWPERFNWKHPRN